jgi:peptide/nickel transport system substrate-binding protein
MSRSSANFPISLSTPLLIIMLTVAVVAASQPVEAAGTGNVNVTLWEDIDNLNPHIGPTWADAVIFSWLYETLTVLDENLTLAPWLAESWTMMDPGGYSWTFNLVHNATWHDGVPLTAYDVEYTFRMLINGSVNFPGPWFSAVKDVKNVTAIDQYTVLVEMQNPRALTVDYVGRAIPIIPKHIYENLPEPYKSQPWMYLNLENPIGSGPFKFKSRTPGQQIILENTGNHWKVKPHIQTITYNIISSVDVALLALQRGDVDALLQWVSPSTFQAIRSNPEAFPNFKTSNVSLDSTATLSFNLRLYPYNITELRRAVSNAIDIDQIISKVWYGYAQRASPGYTPPYKYWYNPNIPPYELNLTKAGELLDQAGFTVGSDGWRKKPDGTPFTMKLLCANDETTRDIAAYVKNDLAKVGINVYIDAKDPTSVYTTLRNKRTDWETSLNLNRDSYAISMDNSDTFYYRFHSSRATETGWNIVGYNNPEVDDLVANATLNFNVTDRVQKLWRVQEILAEEVPRVSLYHMQILNVYRDDRVTGWVALPTLGIDNLSTWENIIELRPQTPSTPAIPFEALVIAGIVVVIIIASVITFYFYKKHMKKGVGSRSPNIPAKSQLIRRL